MFSSGRRAMLGKTASLVHPAGVYQRVRDHFGFISGMISTWEGKAGKRPRNNGCTNNGGFYHDDEDVDDANLLDATHNYCGMHRVNTVSGMAIILHMPE